MKHLYEQLVSKSFFIVLKLFTEIPVKLYLTQCLKCGKIFLRISRNFVTSCMDFEPIGMLESDRLADAIMVLYILHMLSGVAAMSSSSQ